MRKIDHAGGTVWRQVELPRESHAVLAMIPLDFGFALLVSSQPSGIQNLLWFDPDGNITAHVSLPFLGMDLSAATLGLSNARVAYARVASTLADQLKPGSFSHDLHVLRLGPDVSLTGHRILAEGPLNPTLKGMAVDADDTIYVTTVTGTRQNPRGLICALPDEREGRCYLAPDGVSPQTITAAAPGVLYALSEETLVKLELPSDERSID